MTLKIRISGHRRVINKLVNQYPARIKATVAAALAESVGEVVAAAVPLTPFKTFDLRRSIRGQVDNRSLRAFVIAGSNQVPYAKFQEYGTLDNAIDPENVSAIRAAIKIGIPIKKGRGIAPRLFLHRGVEMAKPRIVEIFEKKLNRLAVSLGLS